MNIYTFQHSIDNRYFSLKYLQPNKPERVAATSEKVETKNESIDLTKKSQEHIDRLGLKLEFKYSKENEKNGTIGGDFRLKGRKTDGSEFFYRVYGRTVNVTGYQYNGKTFLVITYEDLSDFYRKKTSSIEIDDSYVIFRHKNEEHKTNIK